MVESEGSQFRKPEVGGSKPPWGSTFPSDGEGCAGSVGVDQCQVGPDRVPESSDDEKLSARAVAELEPLQNPPSYGVSVVYFIRSAGLVKVGVTSDLHRRFLGLSTASASPIHLVGFGHGETSRERCIHRMLAATRHHGEWFRPSLLLLGLIEAAMTDSARWHALPNTREPHVEPSRARLTPRSDARVSDLLERVRQEVVDYEAAWRVGERAKQETLKELRRVATTVRRDPFKGFPSLVGAQRPSLRRDRKAVSQ